MDNNETNINNEVDESTGLERPHRFHRRPAKLSVIEAVCASIRHESFWYISVTHILFLLKMVFPHLK